MDKITSTKKKPVDKIKLAKKMTPIIMLLPAIILICCTVLYPITKAIGYSFRYYKLTDLKNTSFIGLQNFINILTNDDNFIRALINSLIWCGIIVPAQLIIALILSSILNSRFWGRGFIRSYILIPWFTPGVLIALMWKLIFSGTYGVLNDILIRIGIIQKNIPWLSSSYAFGCQMTVMIWQGVPFFTVMLLAAMQTIPTYLYEAAEVEGATKIQRFRYITLPGIMTTLTTTFLIRIIWVYNNVDIIYNMTAGGPGTKSLTLMVYTFMKSQKSLDFGYASALSIIGTALLLIIMYIYIRLTMTDEEGDII